MGRRIREIFDEAACATANPVSYSKEQYTKIRNKLLGGSSLTPVSDMRTMAGLLSSYWRSDEWKTAWALTGGLFLQILAYSGSSVLMATYGAQVLDAMLSLSPHYTSQEDTSLAISIGILAAIGVARFLVESAGHMMSTTLNRKAAKHINDKFNEAVLENRAHVHLLYCSDHASDSALKMPDNIDQRIEESPAAAMGSAIGLTIGILRAVTSIGFIGYALTSNSAPVEALPFLGDYGTATLAFAAAAAYVPVNTFIAFRLGKILERLTTRRQQAQSAYRGELNTFTRRHIPVAAANGEKVQKKIYDGLYDRVNNIWHRENMAHSGYLFFTHMHNFFQTKLVSYLPGLPALASGAITTKAYLETSELVSHLISDCSWFINVMPAIAHVRSYSGRLTELAEAIETVQDSKTLYKQNGVAEINIKNEERDDIYIDNLELMMPGKTETFLQTDRLTFERGDWVAIQGTNGSGKSTFMKAINGLWPFGRGDIYLPENATKMYAFQDVRLERTTLKQIICVPNFEEEFDDYKVQSALEKAGLEKFTDHIHEEYSGVKRWEESLSGGEKQKIRLAQILLHKPELIFLDEATSAMDGDAKEKFHKLIKEHCPDSVVISIVHDEKLLGAGGSENFYNRFLWVDEGRIIESAHPLITQQSDPAGPRPPMSPT